jgi:hypothetical protein
LNQHVPQVCGDGNPVLTFLGYEKSLKVVLRDARTAEYRLEYLTLPECMPVATFRHKTQSIERGLLAAIDYRHFQMSHGTYRDNDPLPRAASGNKSLPPGERVKLISLEGVGTVKWLRLHAEPKVLSNDDLWLEVTVDGEGHPALAAPARYLFPGLEEGKNYHNFLVINKGGLANVLPMPYGKGLSIAAVNRGAKELKNLGVSVSYEPLPVEPEGRLRLRGVFANGESTATLAGRCIGLIWQRPSDGPTQQLLTGINGGEQTRCLSGQSKSLTWWFPLLAPPDQQQLGRLELPATPRLALFYCD